MGLSNFLNRLAGLKTEEELALETVNFELTARVADLEKEVDALKRNNRDLRESIGEISRRLKDATRSVFDVGVFASTLAGEFEKK